MKTVAYGIVGLGKIAPVHAEAIGAVKGAELVDVCARQPGKARAFAAKYGGEAYTDMAAMVRAIIGGPLGVDASGNTSQDHIS